MQKTVFTPMSWRRLNRLALTAMLFATGALSAESDPDVMRRAMDKACEQFTCQAGYAISFKTPSADVFAQELTVSFSMRRTKGLHYPTRSKDHDAQLDQNLYAASCRLRNLDSESFQIQEATLSPLLRERLQGCIRSLAQRIDRAIDPQDFAPLN